MAILTTEVEVLCTRAGSVRHVMEVLATSCLAFWGLNATFPRHAICTLVKDNILAGRKLDVIFCAPVNCLTERHWCWCVTDTSNRNCIAEAVVVSKTCLKQREVQGLEIFAIFTSFGVRGFSLPRVRPFMGSASPSLGRTCLCSNRVFRLSLFGASLLRIWGDQGETRGNTKEDFHGTCHLNHS